MLEVEGNNSSIIPSPELTKFWQEMTIKVVIIIIIIHVKDKLHMMKAAGDKARILDHETGKIKACYQSNRK